MKQVLVACAALLAHPSASAALIFYEVANLGGTSWEYLYTVENEPTSAAIEAFDIYFDLGSGSNLTVSRTPVGWDGVAIVIDPGLPDGGFVDWCGDPMPDEIEGCINVTSTIAPGESLAGFGAIFDFAGAGMPGVQRFEIIDPLTFDVLTAGLTQPRAPVAVPEPGVRSLLIGGLIALTLLRRRVSGPRGRVCR